MAVKTDGQQLADIMEQRPLGLSRNPNSQPVSNNMFRPETRDSKWCTDVQEKAEAAGYIHHYVPIGALCDRLPEMPGWDGTEQPVFHFPPGKALKGTEIARDALEQRHVIEICPFRAWSLVLHNTQDYDLANALNLGIMADLVYAAEAKNPTIDYFSRRKCQDLSCLPQFAEYPNYFHTLAVDVTFRVPEGITLQPAELLYRSAQCKSVRYNSSDEPPLNSHSVRLMPIISAVCGLPWMAAVRASGG